MKISEMLKKILAILIIITILLNVFAVECRAGLVDDIKTAINNTIDSIFRGILVSLSGEDGFYYNHDLRKSLCIYYRR